MCTVLRPDIHVDDYVLFCHDPRLTVTPRHRGVIIQQEYMKLMYPRTDSSRFDTTLRNKG